MVEIDNDVLNDVLEAAIKTYELEKALDPDSDAIKTALNAGFIKVQQQTMEEIATAAEELAAHILSEEDPTHEGAAALQLFAHDIKGQIPKVGTSYVPDDDDIVEVFLSGEVTVYYNECPNCGQLQDISTWSVKDRATGEEYFFDEARTKNLRVRLIAPGGIDELIS